ncbi:MAG: hypothetical protein RR700_06360 [Anaerorhabdus sp.]|uniref:hypothetical protein n=1 Tax=Anaerorhabdus sp. TaxID=1872524 RepID=UPI002FC61614
MIFIFIGFSLFIWLLWFYDSTLFKEEKQKVLLKTIEQDYIFLVEHTSKKTWQKAHRDRICIAFLVTIILMMMNVTNEMLSIIVFVIAYIAQYQILKNKYNQKLKKASLEFPYLLDKLAGLVQVNTIPVSLNKAVNNCPELFRKDLEELVSEIHNEGESLRPYLKFARKFHQVEELESIMRTLYSLSIAGANKEAILVSFCNLANEKIRKCKVIDYENTVDSFNLFSYGLYGAMGVLVLALFTTINFFSL